MSQDFKLGDFLVYQLESGFALLRVLAFDSAEDGGVWHLSAYGDFFPDVDSAESAVQDNGPTTTLESHMALTQRGFENTQVAKIGHRELSEIDIAPVNRWRRDAEPKVFDRSVRLVLGLR